MFFPVGTPRTIQAGIPRINTPGQDSFKLPRVVPAIDSPFTAGLPEVVIAKDPGQINNNNSASFSSFKVLHGLKTNLIFSIIQDKAGNIWIATYEGGVSKYDGRSFTRYTTSQGLSTDNIWSMMEDSHGNLWFGTVDGGGVSKYDGKSFTNYSIGQGLSGNSVISMIEDSNGDLWFGTERGGVNKFDGKSFIHYTTAQGLIDNHVRSIVEDSNGNFWFGTDGGVSKFDGKSFSNYTTDQGLSNNGINSIIEDSNGKLWMSSQGGGVNRYDGRSFTHYTTAQGLISDDVGDILKAKDGSLWMCTHRGVNRFDGKSFTHFGIDQGLSSNAVTSIVEDKTGNFWFGTEGGGVCKYDGGSFTHYHQTQGLSEGGIISIREDRKGNIWIGKWRGGVDKFDGKSIAHYTTAQGLSSNNVECILEDRHGNLWFGNFASGVDKYDASGDAGETFTHFSTAQGLSSDAIYCIIEDKKGNLWFGTLGGGVSKYDGSTFTRYNTAQGLTNGIITCILEDKNGNIWIGTYGGGVNKYDGKSFSHYSTPNGQDMDNVMSIYEDSQGNIWVGTYDGGVIRFDGKSLLAGQASYTQYTTEQGLSNNRVSSIREDKNGNIWFLTSNGLCRMRLPGDRIPEKRGPGSTQIPLFKNYLVSDGFLGVGSGYNNLITDRYGNIWAGTNDRLTCFHPERDVPDSIPPNIQLSGISLFNENINWLSAEKKKDTTLVLSNGVRIHDFQFSGLSKWYYTPEQLKLVYNNNYLTFQFIGITTKRPNEVKYQFLLEGLDDNWSSITDKPEASYSDLPHGKYTFKVKAVNSEGYWSNESSYPFEIRPPWWQTNLAYLLYILIFALLLWAFIQYRSRQLIKDNLILEKKVIQRTNELSISLNELKKTQNQLVQREKMASLGELTAGIAHEIQNPLNFVNNFAEVNSELLEELKEDRRKPARTTGSDGKLEYRDEKLQEDIIHNIAENEQKIIHHGHRADAIVKGMLQHSRISSDSAGLKEPTDINALADEYLRLAYHAFQAGLRAKDKSFNSEYKMDLDPALPLVNVIPQDIGRVFLNLFNNAFWAVNEKANLAARLAGGLAGGQGLNTSTPGVNPASSADRLPGFKNNYTPTVTLTTKKLTDYIEIRIHDNGPGIPPSIIEKIFQPFFTTKSTGEGTGLGLSMAYDIVTKVHGGELTVESEVDKYARFTIRLPLR